MAEKMRVHILAKELGVPSKAILQKCRAEGLDVKNHMTALSAGLEATIREWFSEGAHLTTVESSERVDVKKIRKTTKRKRTTAKATTARKKKGAGEEEAAGEKAVAVAELPAEAAVAEAPAATAVAEAPAAEPVTEAPAAEVAPPPAPEEPPAPEAPPAPAAAELAARTETPEAPPAPPEEPKPPEPVVPAGPQNIPAPAQLMGPRVVRVEAPEPVRPRQFGPRRPSAPSLDAVPLPTELRPPVARRARRKEGPAETPDAPVEEPPRKRRGQLSPRRSRLDRDVVVGERLKEWRERDLIEREERMKAASGGGLHSRRAREVKPTGGPRPQVIARRTKVQVTEPIALHEFCAATGLGMNQLLPKLIREHNIVATRNTTLDPDLAEMLAAEGGIELEIIRAKTALQELEEEVRARPRQRLEPRPPVVAFLGHVDHGKTSLLDAIRKSRVVEGESGGITQHIGAYRLDRDGLSVTFLDTPGHEAFTAMRARGANLTDVVVLVVAADDGVMPQTVEAINHARAAEVSIVVALNKIDLPGVDVNKVLGQLAERQLVPQEWGGDVDVIRTSATTGEGIDELVEHLAALSELLELRADPHLPAHGTVVEAEMKEGVGVSATVLVQEGTLRPGDIIVCGPGCGRVRALRGDRGRVESAGPATPVEVIGLDELPNAGDRFYQVDSLARGKEIAAEVRQRRRSESLSRVSKPRSLEDLFAEREQGEIPELNLILKADVQGSVDALVSALGDIPTEEVKLRFLHAGVGAITEGDVILAEASGATIVGFHVVPETGVQRLADSRGVDIRLYRVIYDIVDDIRQALEGLLAPERKEEASGRAEVRQTFNVTKVGTVAGCLVVDGVIHRADYVRLIRDGRIILPTEEDVNRQRHRQIQSLKRFKDDAKEVRAGLECGIKIEDYDDVKPGDIIEAYSIVEVSRKL